MFSLDAVREYYEAKLRDHGATPAGVDWNGASSQRVRFNELTKVIAEPGADGFSLDDYGCGYGAYLDYLHERGFKEPDYLGLDVSAEMINEARRLHAQGAFVVASKSPRVADYAVASGIFNVALEQKRAWWEQYIRDALDVMHAATEQGFAFNCLTSYSDEEYRRAHLYYGDPCFFFDLCKRRYSRQVALLHDYGLYELTIIVRKAK
jgi:SAM-dependent methyltransferase